MDSDPTFSESDHEDYAPPGMKSELELLREQNIRERDAFIASLMSDPEFADIMTPMDIPNKNKKTGTRRSNGNGDSAFIFHGKIPTQKRKSARLQNLSPIFTKDDLPMESAIANGSWFDNSYDDIEEVVYQPTKPRISTKRTENANIIPVEAVTQDMINNIARRGTNKVYSEKGTCCHQCRQKTMDQKTSCRNINCAGLKGQFCGVCLQNRYGEDVAVVLKDPNWHCPVCRGICNCSFCRAKAGKRPTGILAPIAQQAGHKSVKDFLESLKGEGDYAYQDKIWQEVNSANNLLGFSEDLTTAHMGNNVQHKMQIFIALEKMRIYIRKSEKKLASLIEDHNKSNILLGFIASNTAVMGDGSQEDVGCHWDIEKFQSTCCGKENQLSLLINNEKHL